MRWPPRAARAILPRRMETFARALAGALVALALTAAPAGSECIEPPPIEEAATPPAPTEGATVQTLRDRRGRVVAPVHVNGQGPYRFIVDTGANRSVISPDLAARLGLQATTTGDVHSIEGVQPAPIAEFATLTHGDVQLSAAPMPILGGSVLAGEYGLLGVDGMQGRRLRMELRRRCIEIIPSQRAPRLRGFVTIQGELRFGHLVVVPGRVRDIDVNVLIDTGADSSLGNVALREALGPVRVRENDPNIGRAFTAGRPIVLERAVVIPRVTMGDVGISNVAAYIGDFHIFSLWGFQNEPTLLIGMDVIGQAEALAIDYERATVSFRLPRRNEF